MKQFQLLIYSLLGSHSLVHCEVEAVFTFLFSAQLSAVREGKGFPLSTFFNCIPIPSTLERTFEQGGSDTGVPSRGVSPVAPPLRDEF